MATPTQSQVRSYINIKDPGATNIEYTCNQYTNMCNVTYINSNGRTTVSVPTTDIFDLSSTQPTVIVTPPPTYYQYTTPVYPYSVYTTPIYNPYYHPYNPYYNPLQYRYPDNRRYGGALPPGDRRDGR